jgi:hypothetical protein
VSKLIKLKCIAVQKDNSFFPKSDVSVERDFAFLALIANAIIWPKKSGMVLNIGRLEMY